MQSLEHRLLPIRSIALLAIGALIVWMAALAAPVSADPPGNNGTVKIHEGNTENEPIVANDPHVCTFHLHFFFGDDVQSGDWWITAWPPNGEPSADQGDAVLEGEYDATGGEDRVPDNDTFDATDLGGEGHYKLFWEGAPAGESGNVNIKHKVFWVDCEGSVESQQLRLVKESDEGGVLASVSFTLTAQGASTGTTLMTDAQGRLTFDDLDPGTYTLTEVAPANCVGVGTLTLTIAADGTVTVMNQPASVTVSGDTLTIVNDCGFGTVPLLKVDQAGAGRAGAVFTLTGVMGTTFSATSTSTANGSAGFSNLTAGNYTLAETTPPTGCTGFTGTIAISIAANGTVTFGSLPTGVTVVSGTVRVVNTCGGGLSGNLPLLKVDASGAGRAGAQFTLTGVSGTNFSATVTTIAAGSASFGTLAAGSYSLAETRAPAQCTGITTAIAITVAANGTVSVGTLPTGVTFTNGTLRVVNNCEQGGNLPSGGGPATTPTRSGTLAGSLPNTSMPAPAPMGTVAGAFALVLLGGLVVSVGATLAEVRRRR
jgi:hypothetical protein